MKRTDEEIKIISILKKYDSVLPPAQLECLPGWLVMTSDIVAGLFVQGNFIVHCKPSQLTQGTSDFFVK